MSNDNATKPTFSAYNLRKYIKNREEKTAWTRIGTAWPNHDGDGWNIQLDALPLGDLVIRRDLSDEEKEAKREAKRRGR